MAFSLAITAFATASAQQMNYGSPLHAKAVLHEDGTRTESVKDVPKREMLDTTFDSRGVAITKKRFLLNAKGDALQGVIYDGADNLLANVQFYFDNLGRVIEERCVNTKGQIFRRVIRQYDPNGKPLEAKAFDYAVNMPQVKAPPINFTKNVPPPNAPATLSAPPKQPGTAPQIQRASPTNGIQNKEPEKKKKGWFGRDKS